MRSAALLLVVLAACKKDVGIQPRRTAGSDSADQVYAGMTTEIVRDGVRQSHVYADSAWAYQARQVVDLTRMTVTMFDSSGAKVSTIVADKGIYYTRRQSLDARGHVIATSTGGKVLKTEHLIYDRDKNQVSSDTFFTSTSPDGQRFGRALRIRSRLQARPVNKMKGQQKGKGIAIARIQRG